MLPAQVDVTASGLSDFAGKFGFPALLVIILLVGIYKMLASAKDEREKRDDRDEARELGRRAERKEDREAHLTALGKHTEVIAQLGAGMVRLEQKVDNLDRDVTDLKTRPG
jgi:hypothetical protein